MLGTAGKQTDVLAHLFGLLAGFLVGAAALIRAAQPRPRWAQALAATTARWHSSPAPGYSRSSFTNQKKFRAPLRLKFRPGAESNFLHADFQSAALPAWALRRVWTRLLGWLSLGKRAVAFGVASPHSCLRSADGELLGAGARQRRRLQGRRGRSIQIRASLFRMAPLVLAPRVIAAPGRHIDPASESLRTFFRFGSAFMRNPWP